MWCDQIYWRIEQGDHVLAGSEDDRPVMESAIDQINGRVLLSGQIAQLTGDSLLEFTDNLVLKTFVPTSEEDARWYLKHAQAEYILLGPVLTPSVTELPQ